MVIWSMASAGRKVPSGVDPLGHHQRADHEHGHGQGERDAPTYSRPILV